MFSADLSTKHVGKETTASTLRFGDACGVPVSGGSVPRGLVFATSKATKAVCPPCMRLGSARLGLPEQPSLLFAPKGGPPTSARTQPRSSRFWRAICGADRSIIRSRRSNLTRVIDPLGMKCGDSTLAALPVHHLSLRARRAPSIVAFHPTRAHRQSSTLTGSPLSTRLTLVA
jgi:hypothetical protein